MARKKHLINVHTSTGTTAPTGASLYLGEIAVQHTPNDPALWIKVGSAETSTEYEKFIGLTEITSIFNMSHILGSGYTYSGLPYVNSATTIADAYSALTKELIDDELVTAAALNDLNQRVVEISGMVGDNTELIEYIQENEEVVAGALNNLNNRVSVVETHMTGDYIPITGYMLASGATEEELTLRETDTVNEALGKLQKQSLDNEEAIAAGLNDLNERVTANTAAIAKNTGVTALSGAVRSIQTELNNFESNYSYYTGNTIYEFSGATKALSSATQSLSASVQSISAKTSGVLTINANGVEQGRYSPSANTTIDLQIVQDVTGADVLLTGYELATGTTEEELAIVATDTVNEAFGKIQKQNYDNEAVIAGALNDLDERVLALESGGGAEDIWKEIEDQELIVAAALNDLNSRIVDLSGNTSYDVSNLNSQLNILSGIVADISGNTGGGGGGGTDTACTEAGHYTPTTSASTKGTTADTTNYIKGIRLDSKNHVIDVVTGAVVTAQTQLSKGTATGAGNVVTDINVSGHQITLVKSYSAAPADQFVTLSGATTGINATLTAHTNNGDIHVTAANKTTWNGKQDAISDLSEIRSNAASGMAAYNNVNALSAATTAHTGNNNIHVTAAQKTNWTNSGTSGANAYVGYIAHSANTGIHVTSTEKSTWNGKQNAISDLATIRSNAASGMVAYNNVNTLSAGTISELAKKSNTGHTHAISDITNLQTTLNGKSDTGHTHSNYATTGTVNTLNNTVTAHTANTAIHVTTAQTAAWDGKQDAINDLTTIRNNASSGASAYTGLTALSAATTAHTGNSDIHVTSTEKSTWNGKANTSDITITGLTVGGTNATVTNKVAAVPTASTSAFGVVKVPAQATSFLTNSNGTIGVATGTGANQVAVGNHTHTASQVGALPTGTTLDGIADGTTRKLSNYATTGNVNTLSSATQSIQSSAQTAYNSRITGGTITSGATNSITTTNNRVAITAATLPSYSTANNDQVLMIKNGVPQWVTPSTITYSSSAPTGGNNGDIWIQTS